MRLDQHSCACLDLARMSGHASKLKVQLNDMGRRLLMFGGFDMKGGAVAAAAGT